MPTDRTWVVRAGRDAAYIHDFRSKGQSGERCKRLPITGGTVCMMNGVGAPQVRLKALERLAAYQHNAIDRCSSLVEQTKYPSTYAAVRDVLDRTMGKPTEQVDMRVSGGAPVNQGIGL